MVQLLKLPRLSADPVGIQRSGFRWLQRSGDQVGARDPIAVCYLRLTSGGDSLTTPFREEQNDFQVVLAPSSPCHVRYASGMSKGGYRDMTAASDWQAGEVLAEADSSEVNETLMPLVLAGRRGLEVGEGRSGHLLPGWHEQVRGFWSGGNAGPYGTVLALGTCEQTAIFRGDDMAFLSWFRRAPGPAQIIAVSDERCVHSSAVVLQHLRRTPQQAQDITCAVHSWIGERLAPQGAGDFPGLGAEAYHGTRYGRWPKAQDVLYALNLLAEAVGTSPILARTDIITAKGVIEAPPANAIAMTLGSEFAPHFRHRKTGWIIAIHGFRFGPYLSEGIADWLRRDFEMIKRSVSDVQRDIEDLANEIKARTGALLVMQNLVASTASDRVSNYSWLGDTFNESVSVLGNEANLMLAELTQKHRIAQLDSDALAVEFGVDCVPDRYHASGELVEAQRQEVHRILKSFSIPGF